MSTNLLFILVFLLFLLFLRLFYLLFFKKKFSFNAPLYSHKWFVNSFLCCSQLSLEAVVKCIGFRSQGFSPVYLDTSIGGVLVQVLFRKSWWWDVICVASDIPKRHNLTANYLILWFLQLFHPLFFTVPQALCVGVFCQMYLSGIELYILAFWLVVV